MKICSRCKRTFSNNEMYCDRCGTLLEPLRQDPDSGSREVPYGQHEDYREDYGYSDLSYHNHGQKDPGNDHDRLYKIIIACMVVIMVIAIAVTGFYIIKSREDSGGEPKTEEKTETTTLGEEVTTEAPSTITEDEDWEEPSTQEDLIPDDQLKPEDEPVIEDEDVDDEPIIEDEDVDDDYSADFIFPDSDSRYLSDGEVRSLNQEDTRIAINEIYARRGYRFTTDKWKKHFSRYDWYHPTLPEGQEPSFNKYERENKEKLAQYEKDMGWRK